jgi:Icc-related predicted phosphoesterase
MNFRFCYGTDFHGEPKHFNNILDFSVEQKIDLIHLGADILPKGYDILKEQKQFTKGFLKNWYTKCTEKGITVLAMFGNDDLYSRKKYFREYATLLDEHPYSRDGYNFYGYEKVTDYPFSLKSACKLDYPGWIMKEEYLGKALDINEDGFVPITDVKSYFDKKGTIEEDLKTIPGGKNALVAIHCPPQGMGLDVCVGGRRVGSKSVAEWIVREQPLLVLCGHIHESYNCSGIWKTEIQNTTVIQPGQIGPKTTVVLIEIQDQHVNAQLLSL